MQNIVPPPFIQHDVACPVILADGDVLLRPYVVSLQRPWPVNETPLALPTHLVVLEVGASIYVHTDPRQVAWKKADLLRTGNVEECRAWLYSSSGWIVDHAGGNADSDHVVHALFPGTPDRFYFNPLLSRVEAKQMQIADERYRHAEFYCPAIHSRVVSYHRTEEL